MVASNHENFTHEIYVTTNNHHVQHIFTQLFVSRRCDGPYGSSAIPGSWYGVPDPSGALSFISVPSQAIAEANREVQEATSDSSSKKRGPSPVTASHISW